MNKCANCIFLRELWTWDDYPRDKKYGYCCIMLDRCKESWDKSMGVVMQLQNTDGRCEMFAEVEDELDLV